MPDTSIAINSSKYIKNIFVGAAIFFLFVGLANINSNKKNINEEIKLKALGVKIMVTDLEKAKDFYVKKLGFKINEEHDFSLIAFLILSKFPNVKVSDTRYVSFERLSFKLCQSPKLSPDIGSKIIRGKYFFVRLSITFIKLSVFNFPKKLIPKKTSLPK